MPIASVACWIVMRPAVIGWREWVGLPELQRAPLLAKVDTGAWSNTLHASEIDIIESNPETRIRFRLEEGGKWIERPLQKWRRIRDTGGHETLRPVIRTTIEIASRDFDVEVCLADRSKLKHRMILGRNFLRLGFIVNPSRQCVHTMIRSEDRVRMGSMD
ncbi:MAG: ATP-dependent zinc protease [Euryarchaeota archaeon]|nr:ATP-dependent zinc protease [Euryarchaeota archaeon]